MIDTSILTYLMPLLAFLFIVILVYALLLKTGILGASKYIMITLALIIGLVFISFSKLRDYLMNLIPYLLVLFSVCFFLLILLVFITKDWEKIMKPLTWVIVVVFALMIIILAFKFFPTLYHLLPKTSNYTLNSPLTSFKTWLYSKRIVNTLIFTIATAIVAIVITRK